MRKYGAFEVTTDVYRQNEKSVQVEGSHVEPNGVITREGKAVGVMIDGEAVVGYNTPSRKLELFSQTMVDWKWPEYALPEYIPSHVHPDAPPLDWPPEAHGDIYTLLPIFR